MMMISDLLGHHFKWWHGSEKGQKLSRPGIHCCAGDIGTKWLVFLLSTKPCPYLNVGQSRVIKDEV